MTYSTPSIFDENHPLSWRTAAVFALLAALAALRISPEFSLINAGLSLTAVAVSLLISAKLPKGSLALWMILFFGVWLSPLSKEPAEAQRLIFGVAMVLISLVYQGSAPVFFFALLGGIGLNLQSLSRDLLTRPLAAVLLDDSFQFFQVTAVFASSIFFLRISRTRTCNLQRILQSASENLDKTRGRISATRDSVQIVRENLLGRALSQGEVFSETVADSPLDPSTSNSASFDTLIATLRQSFSEFQVQGRATGKIAGPIRFVFFTPAAGYDEKSVISVDLDALVSGVKACLELALESLPEIGARKREGVIRLSIRYGLRVIEVSVEDNGRGIVARNLDAETKLSALKELCVVWGGTFDRVSRLGVGSRTTLELRILRERQRTYRATLKHPVLEASQLPSAPRV